MTPILHDVGSAESGLLEPYLCHGINDYGLMLTLSGGSSLVTLRSLRQVVQLSASLASSWAGSRHPPLARNSVLPVARTQ
jgi:hypothetical protein